MEWFLPKLAVTFANEGRPPVPGEAIVEELENLHGRTRTTCQLCGECDVGCNYGAKNTLDYNYLTHAAHHGAELRTLCDVRRFEPREGGGYAVHYAALDDVDARRGRRAPAAAADGHLRPPRAQRRHARHHQPAAAQPQRLPAAEPPPGHALLRQRRPAHAGDQHPRDGRRQAHAADRRSRLRPGHHEHGAHARRARRRRGPRLLPPGRRLSAAAGLDPARPRRAQVAVGVALDRRVPGQELAAGLARHRRQRLHRRPAAVRASCRPAACRCWGWAATSPTGGCSCATAGSTSTGTASARPSTSRACATTSRDFAHALGGQVRRQPDLVPAPRDHRPPAGRLPDGPRRHRGRRRPARQRLRLSRACISPTARSCQGPSVPTRASRSPRSPTASPTAC